MTRTHILGFAVWIGCYLLPSAGWSTELREIEFLSKGRSVTKIKLTELKKRGRMETLTVWQPEESTEATYRGLNAAPLLKRIFGKDWDETELVLFICADGYKAPVPRAMFDVEKSLLAFERTGKSFSISNKSEHKDRIELGPLYLIWNNLKNPQIKAEGGTNWPYQVVAIELTTFATKFPHLSPSKDASPSVMNGFKAYQKYCMTCHKLKGDGGTIGPDLTPIVAKPGQREHLEKWISNPSSINPYTGMPPINKNIAGRKEVISQIVSYLESMGSTP